MTRFGLPVGGGGSVPPVGGRADCDLPALAPPANAAFCCAEFRCAVSTSCRSCGVISDNGIVRPGVPPVGSGLPGGAPWLAQGFGGGGIGAPTGRGCGNPPGGPIMRGVTRGCGSEMFGSGCEVPGSNGVLDVRPKLFVAGGVGSVGFKAAACWNPTDLFCGGGGIGRFVCGPWKAP